MDLLALGLGKAVCQASTAIVHRLCSAVFRSFHSALPRLLLLRGRGACDRPQREAARSAALECAPSIGAAVIGAGGTGRGFTTSLFPARR